MQNAKTDITTNNELTVLFFFVPAISLGFTFLGEIFAYMTTVLQTAVNNWLCFLCR